MNWRVVANARSLAKGDWDADRLRQLVGHLTSDVQVTQYAGHALALTRDAPGADGFIVLGGDGTLHEVLQHLDLPRQRLMIIPAGTGNSLAKDLGLHGLALTSFPQPGAGFRSIDVLAVRATTPDGQELAFKAASTVAIGYPAEATRFANLRLKQTFGKHCYAIASGTHLFSRRKHPYLVTYDALPETSKSLYGLLLSNTRHMGNFLCFRDAAPDNGLTDVVELKSGLFPQLLHNACVLTKTYWYDPSPSFPHRLVRVRLPEPSLLMADGEIYPPIREVEVSVLPGALQVMAFPARALSEAGKRRTLQMKGNT